MSFRIEEKFIINSFQFFEFKNYLLEKKAINIFQKRKIISLYFDNSNYQMYYDSVEGSLPRKKIRLRNYQNKKNYFEFKISSTEGRFKTSHLITQKKFDEIKNIGILDNLYGSCKPLLFVEYNREYFEFKDIRVTIDNDINYFSYHRKFLGDEKDIVVELKAPFKKSINELMTDFPFPRSRFSKYCNGVEKLLIK
jgi:SPX domain protein involved in polyphosphate accumulation